MSITPGTKTDFTPVTNSTSATQEVVVASGVSALVISIVIFDTSSTQGVVDDVTFNTDESFVLDEITYEATSDAHLSIWKLDSPTETTANIVINTAGTSSDIMASVLAVTTTGGVLELDAAGTPSTNNGSPSQSHTNVEANAIVFWNMMTDQQVGGNVTLDGGGTPTEMFLQDLGGDTGGAAYEVVSAAEAQVASWTDSDDDEDWHATSASYKEGVAPEESIVTAGSFTFSGKDPTSTEQSVDIVTAGSFTFSGLDPNSAKGFSSTTTAGSFTFSGKDPVSTVQNVSIVTAGSFTFSGKDIASVDKNISILTAGSFTFSGLDLTSAVVGGEPEPEPEAASTSPGGGRPRKKKYAPHLSTASQIGLGGQQSEKRAFQTRGADRENEGVSKSVRDLHKTHVEFTGKYVPLKTYDTKFKKTRKGYMKTYRKKPKR